ncbi:hypothetical protein D3C80_1997750 [compost metagenome]
MVLDTLNLGFNVMKRAVYLDGLFFVFNAKSAKVYAKFIKDVFFVTQSSQRFYAKFAEFF